MPSEIKNDETSYWFEVGKILDMKDISDKDDYLEDNVRYRDGFNNCTKEQSKFASRTLSQLYNIINEGKFISNSYIYYLHAKDDPRSIYDYLPSGDIYLTILENPSEINIEKVKEIVALLNININDIFDYSK